MTVCGLCLEDSNSGQFNNKESSPYWDYKSQPIEKRQIYLVRVQSSNLTRDSSDREWETKENVLTWETCKDIQRQGHVGLPKSSRKISKSLDSIYFYFYQLCKSPGYYDLWTIAVEPNSSLFPTSPFSLQLK